MSIEKICQESYKELSKEIECFELQEGCAVRNVLRARSLAIELIDQEGHLDQEKLLQAIEGMETHTYFLSPGYEADGVRQEHMQQVLKTLQQKKGLQHKLLSFTKPINHPKADEIIRETLDLEGQQSITDVHVRQAVLAAWLTFLRQNVGSCFATAPAILVQKEQPEKFLADLFEILMFGSLKRVFGGDEHTVPISVSWGAGDLKKPFYISDWGQFTKYPSFQDAMTALGIKVVPMHGWTTVEAVIESSLKQHLNLTDHDLKVYRERPRKIIPTNLMMEPSSPIKAAQYEILKKKGESHFKRYADNALLKTWEFTLASFAETKAQFAKWNFYSSLGLGTQEKGGIGACLYTILKEKVEEYNHKSHDLNDEYEMVYGQLKYTERRVQNADSEQQSRWLRAEYQSKLHQFQTVEEMRNHANNTAHRFANLFEGLISLYIDLFPKYFQEVYDADLHDIDQGPYNDSPAGFRLVYKHGRSHSSQWTTIEDHHQFIEALVSFFIATETEIQGTDLIKGIEKEVAAIVTDLVMHVKTKEFLETAFSRMAVAHQAKIITDPLEHLGKVKIKPWVYTSGGTMGTRCFP